MTHHTSSPLLFIGSTYKENIGERKISTNKDLTNVYLQFSMITIEPVSYTHLDVYKRQSWWHDMSKVD